MLQEHSVDMTSDSCCTSSGCETSNSSNSITSLHQGLNVSRVTGILHLDRSVRMRALATATLRGLAGHALRASNPMAFDQYFKRSPGEDLPPSYLFEPLEWVGGQIRDSFPFRVVSLENGTSWIDALQEALWMAKGMPFGAGGARVRDVEWAETQRLHYEGADHVQSREQLKIKLITPLQLRLGGQHIPGQDLCFGHLIRAALIRINLLSRNFGNGLQLEEISYLCDALGVREIDRKLRDVLPKRTSATQRNHIHLHGVVGSLSVRKLTPKLVDLLCAAELLHIGRHTVEGCGMIRIGD